MNTMDYVENVFPYTYPSSGNVTFTGPDGLRDYKAHLVEDTLPIGIGCLSEQETTSTAYLFRAAPGTPFARPRSCRPGEVGWGVPDLMDWGSALTGQQIVLGDMRQLAEDRSTHQNLGAWYPPPAEDTPLGSDGYYKENIYSGRPGTANVKYVSSPGSSRNGRPPSSPTKRPSSSSRHSYSPHRPASVRFTNDRSDGVWTNRG